MKTFRLIGCICSLMFTSTLFAQTPLNSADPEKDMTIFEGFNPKYVRKNQDFSSQINELQGLSNSEGDFEKKDFWTQWELEGLPIVDHENNHQVEFCENLKEFYNSLDGKVHHSFSVSDLWYISLHNSELATYLKQF